MLLIAGNRTQVLDLVQLIDVTVNELIVLIRRVFVDRHHILTSQTVHSFPTLSTYKLIYVNLESERTLKFFSASKAQISLSKPLCKAFMEIITVATRRSEGRRARCITRTTTWPTSSSPRTWSRLRSSTGPCSTSAERSSYAATGGERRLSAKFISQLSSRSTINEDNCKGIVIVDSDSIKWNEDGSITYSGRRKF